MNELYDDLANELEAARELHAIRSRAHGRGAVRNSDYSRGLVDGLEHALCHVAERLAEERYVIPGVVFATEEP